jgi:hypothetical protein
MKRPNYIQLRPPPSSKTTLVLNMFEDERFVLLPIKPSAPIEGWRIVDLTNGQFVGGIWKTFAEARDHLYTTVYDQEE